jgi:hypothetical protein
MNIHELLARTPVQPGCVHLLIQTSIKGHDETRMVMNSSEQDLRGFVTDLYEDVNVKGDHVSLQDNTLTVGENGKRWHSVEFIGGIPSATRATMMAEVNRLEEACVWCCPDCTILRNSRKGDDLWLCMEHR